MARFCFTQGISVRGNWSIVSRLLKANCAVMWTFMFMSLIRCDWLWLCCERSGSYVGMFNACYGIPRDFLSYDLSRSTDNLEYIIQNDFQTWTLVKELVCSINGTLCKLAITCSYVYAWKLPVAFTKFSIDKPSVLSTHMSYFKSNYVWCSRIVIFHMNCSRWTHFLWYCTKLKRRHVVFNIKYEVLLLKIYKISIY